MASNSRSTEREAKRVNLEELEKAAQEIGIQGGAIFVKARRAYCAVYRATMIKLFRKKDGPDFVRLGEARIAFEEIRRDSRYNDLGDQGLAVLQRYLTNKG